MMQVMERRIQRVDRGKYQEVREVEAKFDVIEAQLGGFPPKRRYWCYAGGLDHGTFVWEREWESIAEMEAAYAKLRADPEARAARARVPSLSEAGPIELYRPWD